MLHTLNVEWPEDQKELVFSSPTSLITEETLNDLINADYVMRL